MCPADNPTREGKNQLSHVAIIMDGNGRWAKKRFMPRFAGHKAGLDTVRRVVSYCAQNEIDYLTLFAFSSENWRRPEKEVGLLMDLFAKGLTTEVKKLHKNNIKLLIIGDLTGFSEKLQGLIKEATALTANNTGLTLVIAANYGGRWDICQSVKQIANKVKAGQIEPEQVNDKLIEQHLSLGHIPEPDLFIRTGGEQRISNFLLWHLAYCEFFFTDTLWPDFSNELFAQAIDSFGQRQRRFGRTGDQVKDMKTD